MENISHFLNACEVSPLNLPSHDRFLTVDLYDGKDPAQVLQCLAAFSRRANVLNPSAFPTTIGAKTKGSSVSPQATGSSGPRSPAYTTTKPLVPPSAGSPPPPNHWNQPTNTGRMSPTKTNTLSRGGLATGGSISSWASEKDRNNSAPAWNIHQYGYMGGASQGNQGIAFGSRRQITSNQPQVPSLAEKEKQRKEEADRKQREAEEEERRLQAKREAEEERRRQEEEMARMEEERRWAEETRKQKEQEEIERRDFEERERREKEARDNAERAERSRRAAAERAEREAAEQAERDYELKLEQERSRKRATSDARLNGQFLSQYQADQSRTTTSQVASQQQSEESQRIQDLERQLEELRQQQRQNAGKVPPRDPSPARPALPTRNPNPQTSHEDDWTASERDYLRKEWQNQQPAIDQPPPKPARPNQQAEAASRPLPDPSSYTPGTNRTDRYLSQNPAPPPTQPISHRPTDYSTTTEVDLENQRRAASQIQTKAGGWASKSLLEREMERERERQREWEDNQKALASAPRDASQGSGPGQSWDVHQYGYMGGDNQNRGGPGLGVGGARRQIIGPRPQVGKK